MKWLQWLTAEGSTRPAGILRILLVFIAWNRWGDELLPYHHQDLGRNLISAAFYASTAGMLIGWYGRAAAAAAAVTILGLVYGYGRYGGVEDWTHHHTTLIALSFAFLALTPCSTSFSVDRWLAVREAERAGVPAPPERGPTWANHLLALQVSTVYFWSAWDKTTVPFLSGVRLEQIFVDIYWTSDFHAGPLAHAAFMGAAVAVVVLEYVLPFGLWLPAVRTPMIALGVLLHVLFYLILPVSTFSVTMVSLYLMYLDPDEVHRFLDRWMGHRPGSP